MAVYCGLGSSVSAWWVDVTGLFFPNNRLQATKVGWMQIAGIPQMSTKGLALGASIASHSPIGERLMFVKSKKPAVTMTRCSLALLIAFGATSAMAGGRIDHLATKPTAPVQKTDRLIIKYKDVAAPASTKMGMAQKLDTQREGHLKAAEAQFGVSMKVLRQTHAGAHVVSVSKFMSTSDMTALAAKLKSSDPNIEYAEPDRLMHIMATPNDTRYNEMWQLFETTAGIKAPEAWDLSTGSGVTVAVIDTGYRPHADLAANIVGGYDMITDTAISGDGNGRDSDAKDAGDSVTAGQCGTGEPAANSSWHGTHVAGTIAAVGNNNLGVVGVAYNAKVLPIRALGKCGGYTSDIADGIVWSTGGTVSGLPANPNVAKVVSMSLGGGGTCDTTTQNAINGARSRGAVIVVAAGNENQDAANTSPASCSGVITVAAVNRSGGRAYYSNFGSVVTLAAPGGDVRSSASNGILSTLNAGTTGPGADSYANYQGTSMATPHISGVVALMLSKNPNLTPDQVKTKLVQTVRAFPATCSQCGAGIVNAFAAVQSAAGTTPTPPPPSSSVNEVESNNTSGTANAIASATTVNGTMGSSTDEDWFVIDLAAGKTLTATLTPNSTSDYDLTVYNSNVSQIGTSTNGTGAVDTVTVTNSGTSTFKRYIRVKYYGGGTGATNGKYTLKLTF